jgi:hypothetical protein
MVQQVSLASTEYDSGVDEFVKSGLTPIPSDLVKPPRVKESPFQMECRLLQMIELGGKAASGNLAVCEVVKFHIQEDLIEYGIIQPDRIDLVARMGGSYYTRASGESVFTVPKPGSRKSIGYDSLPQFIRESKVLSANNLGQLATVESIPDHRDIEAFLSEVPDEVPDSEAFSKSERLGDYMRMFGVAFAIQKTDLDEGRRMIVLAAKRALDFDDIHFAWHALLCSQPAPSG